MNNYEEKEGFKRISQDDLLEETAKAKEWSGQYLIKVFKNIDGLESLGSGGLIKYRGKFFAVTNAHVVKSLEENQLLSNIEISYKDEQEIDRIAKLIDVKVDKENDLAAFEISPASVKQMYNHIFLDEELLEKDAKHYFVDRGNIVFLHGYPSLETSIDHKEKEVDMTTLPYTTFIKEYDDFSEILTLYGEAYGISEYGNKIDVDTFGGMSGSLAFGYYPGEAIPYKCLGILTQWAHQDEELYVFPTKDLLNFLDKDFFEDAS